MTNGADNMGCIVTGAAGFVGSHLAERLLAMGYPVVGVDNFFSGFWKNMASFVDHPRFNFYERSITDPDLISQLKRAHGDLRVCFHLAAIVSVPYSVDHPEETMEVNYKATEALLDDAENSGFAAFVFAGSAAEYGNDQRLPLKETCATDDTNHLSPYGSSKFLASRNVGLSRIGAALRFFNVYGPRQDPKSPYSGVISRFVDMALSQKTLTVFGDGRQTRDFIYISDVVEAYLSAAGLSGHGAPPVTGIYNVGTGKSTSILELAETVQELAGSLRPLDFLPERPGDIRHSLADIKTYSEATGWTPTVSLKKGLRETIQWVRENPA